MVKTADPCVSGAEEASKDTHTRLREVALELFRTKGYTTTTTRDVAAALGVQQPSLYHHMRHKEELLHGICYNSFLRLIERAEAALAAETEPREKLRVLMSSHLRANIEYQKEFSVSVQECRALSAEYRGQIDALWDRYSATIYSVLDEARAASEVRSDIDHRYLFTAMMDMLNWCVLWYRPGSGMSVEELDRSFFSIYMNGTLATGCSPQLDVAGALQKRLLQADATGAGQTPGMKDGMARLLEAACTLFSRKGYFGTSMRELADAAGIRKATLYHYVTSKEDLIYQISVSAVTHLHTNVERVVNEFTDPLERVQALLTTHVFCLLEHKQWHASATEEMLALSAERRAEIIARRDAYEQLVRCTIQQAQHAGSLRADIPAKVLGLIVLGMINLIYPWYEPEKDLPPAQLGGLLCELVLRGAAPVT